jgi:hypothetical protein
MLETFQGDANEDKPEYLGIPRDSQPVPQGSEVSHGLQKTHFIFSDNELSHWSLQIG